MFTLSQYNDYQIESIGADGATSYAFARGPIPEVTSLSSTSEPAGSTLVITGNGFARVGSVVIAGAVARWKVLDHQTIEAIVPVHATSGPVVVDNLWGRASSGTNFVKQ